MKRLEITKAKPNPLGKDRCVGYIPAAQLGAEWIEFENAGDEPCSLNNIVVYHLAYTSSDTKWEKVMDFEGMLKPGETIRIHSGAGPISFLKSEDVGSGYNFFTGMGYIWNNHKTDTPSLRDGLKREWVDQTVYDAYPPEGVILKRVGDKLIP